MVMNISENAAFETPIEAAVLARKALSSGMTGSLLSAAHNIYQDIAALMATPCTDAAGTCLSLPYKYLPHASSVSLDAVEDKALLDALLAEIGRGSAGYFVRRMLGSDQVLCNLDQAWLRRQYAPHLYPVKHAPHGWHQDGALGFDFVTPGSAELDPEALLPTVTCWIALTWCGVDAPGLEFVSQTVAALLLPEGLTHTTISSRFSADLFWKPQMQAGDAVVFSGATLHRTHVSQQMQRNRTSVELRFVAKHRIPQRLSGDCFVPLPQVDWEPNS
jgi:hypothetical protein